ncbi:hypothetical protein DICPUDRAFT_159415 [Dictyostelium purpureum]|uniref:DEAD/DEAH box helicase n=1 Tax=Dictyostelium purpureum TaxID=5786 RepID=F1A427_DICPU|nr:uncharacterized protein DICPUDRAFT_159415 [Dictyostelium purpureum]EGC29050.1 hypothetical protein DICPUDRAFT_159415 [Dictyostelium purpureum]|eukprot:XP_003294422.1 hypothetical protein DICPUDRAFT_159415 [Dictyostelium purpureum]
MAKGNSSSKPSPKEQPTDKKGSDKSGKDKGASSNAKNSKDDKDSTKNKAPVAKGGKDKGADAPIAPPVQEKPRWTGKTPVQYLNEYCQKNQMDKPIFQESKCKPGKFKYQVTLTFEGKKKQKTQKSYTTDTPFESVQEARAYSALVALYDLCANTTIYKLFPPEFTSYWQQLDQVAKVEAEKMKIEQEEQQKLEQTQEKPPSHTQVIPQIHLSEESMRIVHSLVLELGIGSSGAKDQQSFEERKHLDEKERELILSSLVELGFRESDIEQALLNISNHTNIEGIIEWLCLNIPNSFLPVQFRPKTVGLEKKGGATSDQILPTTMVDINKPIYSRLKSEFENMGFLNRDISKIIGQSKVETNDEMDMFFKVYYKFFKLENKESTLNKEESIEQINDEKSALESIYMNNEIDFKHIDTFYQYQYSGNDNQNTKQFKLFIYIPEFCCYPNSLPIITFTSNKTTQLTNQTVVRSLLNELKETSIGIPMIFNIIAWIDNNQTDILNNKLKTLDPINIDQQFNNNSNNNNTDSPLSSSSSSISSSFSNLSIDSGVSSNKSTKNKKNVDYSNKLTNQEKEKINKDLLENYEKLIAKDLDKTQINKKRQLLPVYKRKEEFLKALDANQVLVVTAETGCGKSTQIPQYILESFVKSGKGSECNIVCTQPRRISAIGVAERVSYEWNCGDNGAIGQMVGYQIRNESKRSASTRLLFCTTGILLRRILDVNSIANVSHIIIDEVHERSTDNDFLLIILREIISKRKDLKIILMSATLNANQISNYFKCNQDSIFSIPGFTYPVKNIYIDEILSNLSKYNPNYKDTISTTTTTTTTTTTAIADPNQELELKLNQNKINFDQKRINYDIVESLILYLVSTVVKKNKSILVFLPGLGDILELCSRLSKPANSFTEFICNKIWCVPLHSSLSPQDQQKVFESAPNGKIKIVISTNIAETSITIEDVEIVVDCGRVNQMSYNSITRASVMEETWTSKASCRQRAGRAGRTSSGLCYKVFTKAMESQFQDQDTPEILRTSLQQLCLHVKLFIGNEKKTTIQQFLSNAIEPPSSEQIQSSINELISIDALDITGNSQTLTPLGHHLASLPVDVYIGKMLLFGCIFRCIDPMLTIAATLSSKSPFLNPSDKKIRPHQKFASHQSDHLMFVNAYNQWRKAIADGNEYQFCKDNYLSISTLRTIQDLKIQFVEILSDIGFLPSGITMKKMIKYQKINKLNGTDGIEDICGYIYNSNSTKTKIINSVLCAGMYPKVGRIDLPDAKYSQTASGAIRNKFQPEDLMIQTKLPPSSVSTQSEQQQLELERVFVHPRSVNMSEGDYVYPFIIFNDKVKTSRMFIHQISNLSPLTLLLFSLGGLIEIDKSYQEITLDHWLKFKATSGKIIVLLKEIRILFNHLLKKKIEQPNYSASTSIIIDIITKLVLSEGYL